MRSGNTYRAARRNEARTLRHLAPGERASFALVWITSGLRYSLGPKTAYRGAAAPASRYMPHNGKREMARRQEKANG